MMDKSARPAGWEFWIDRGGTFTDVIARAPDGAETTAKLLSASPAYEDAGVEAMRRLMGVAPGAPFPAGAVAAIMLGTPVATNALLECKGARTLFVTTRGFGDALLIGDQARPDLFALDIVRPAPLYAGVVEADERLGAAGEMVRPLNETALASDLARAVADGFESVAIAFLHADLNPAHERRAAELAGTAGFRFVSLSAEVSPLPRFIPRAETTVVDAYLTPVVAAYVARLERALAGAPLYFMTSAGALVRAGAFRGRDAIVSGPAGGVVGVAQTAEAAGGKPVLGFDMGGTSTDVCRYAGALERRDKAHLAGVKLRAPMLDVETVAAGGGSILAFDGLRARVGPASAGADPGPACYGRGGPAAVTDANLVLGRLDPARFPPVFGPTGDSPIDPAAARARLSDLAAAMGAASPEAAAEGFLAVAVEQMAGAIRRISTERGFDPRGHALVAFGGAAGQVACQVAEALGVTEVLSPRYASVLSAWGIGQARMRALKAAGLGRRLDEAGVAAAAALADGLEREAAAALAEQGAPAGDGRAAALPQLRGGGRGAAGGAGRCRRGPGGVRSRAPSAVRLHRAGSADSDRQHRGGSDGIPPSPCGGGGPRRGWGGEREGRSSTARQCRSANRPPHLPTRPSPARGGAPDHPRRHPDLGRARLGSDDRGGGRPRAPGPHRERAPRPRDAARHRRPGHPRTLQPSLHGRRRGDGGGAGADGALGEH